MTVAQAKEYIAQGQFEEGTMLPKIEAAIRYLEEVPDGCVRIASIRDAAGAMKGKTGTVITA
jgi:carbamate kinase